MIYQPLLIKNASYYIDIGSTKDHPRHMHSEVELLYCFDGELSIKINDKHYNLKKGELLFIERLTQHEYLATDGKRLALQMGSLFLGDFYNKFSSIKFKKHKLSLNNNNLSEDELKLKELLNEILNECLSLNGEKISLNILGNMYKVADVIISLYGDKQSVEKNIDEGVYEIMEIVRNHYDQDLDINSVSKMINYSKSSFCVNFKVATGQSFHSYLIDYRIRMAQHFLEETKLDIQEISRKVGFKEPKTFTRVFKSKKGMSPRQYRNEIKKKHIK